MTHDESYKQALAAWVAALKAWKRGAIPSPPPTARR